MKKISFYVLLLFSFSLIISCKNSEKKKIENSDKIFSVEANTTTINWVAYKTTSKVPVKGQFTKVNIEQGTKGTTALEALDNLKFTIPVSSTFTKDTIRDNKLKKFFFGTMKNTSLISGVIHMKTATAGTVDITMNGITQELPITYVISDQMVTIEAVMDLDNWQAQTAITALNTVCAELHAGTDGISKTWSEVKIEVATYLKKE